ncbi:MAG: MFS transporter [Oscillospiraceae bacterium]|nr:MFS transporter [Oscillospiraceae bacterium]
MDAKACKRTKYTCYYTYLAMSSVFALPPLLFAAFRDLYDISYTLLGSLVLVNFFTQLAVDLVFSFFSRFFNIHKTIRLMPLVTTVGLCIYAIIPSVFPQYAYVGLLIGTVIFSVASGLAEVLLSPVVAALPSATPEKDMSALHSLYGYGFVGVVVLSTLFLRLVGEASWMYLTLFWAMLPIVASVLFMTGKLPEMNMESSVDKAVGSKHRTLGIALCMVCIFLGSCAENTMSSWISAYAENALHLPKVWGDLFGMALFAALLALTRTAYANYGKNIHNVLIISMGSAGICYLVVALSPSAAVSLIACAAAGICTSMLWPGTLILMEEKIPAVGVTAYALMAAGGDCGASFAPQALGFVVDRVSLSAWAKTLDISAEQAGFKVGMLLAAIFPILGVFLLLYMKKHFKKEQTFMK